MHSCRVSPEPSCLMSCHFAQVSLKSWARRKRPANLPVRCSGSRGRPPLPASRAPVESKTNHWPPSVASAMRVAQQHSHEVTPNPGEQRRAARPNPSLKSPTRYGSHRLATPGQSSYRPSVASRRLPPRSA